ncbi:ATP-binding response regulator [Planomonospora parontospora]|uniref:ATP-binding response regulator n=1 Tax=Planomonospora parontospora TaxID=58119 RepID=UPI00199B4DE4|nr:hybrid sensor histidine kinase/response regulator [Planomonospora parontospora]GGL01921.1 sensor histidine kinase [Planomonospora parontospora subsp. antibiotica]GII16813.1 sensor histidine kinase [Planomonospora parontospora subsp. antibiotica]
MTGEELLRIRVLDDQDVFAMRRLGREVAETAGMTAQDQIRVATALSELGREIAVEGLDDVAVVFLLDQDELVVSLTFAADAGFRPATGVTLAGRLMDAIEADPAGGRVSMRKRLPPGRARLSPAGIRARLGGLTPATALDELRQQNRELAETLEEVRQLNTELEETNQGVLALYNQLSAELEETNRGVVALYAELDEKSRQLREASDARKRFWATVSHQLRTPLNSIIGLVRLLVGPGGDPLGTEQLHQVRLIGSSAETLLALVSELLDMAKAESGRLDPQPATVDLVELVERLRMTLHPTSGAGGVALSVQVSEAPSEILADEVMLTRILRNLLANGLKFTEEGEVRLDVTYDEATREVVFTVTDTGIGIPAEHLDRVFEEFYQVPGPVQVRARGTGLGLPYARRLTEAMGGTLRLSSAPGRGTTVVVRLPHGHDAVPVADRVLVADDDAEFREDVRRMLTGFAVHIDEASDGLTALEAMAAAPPDLALVDLLMPRMDGAALMLRMAEDERLRDVPVVMVTAATSQHYPPNVRAVLPKHGLRRDVLLETVRHALEHEDE